MVIIWKLIIDYFYIVRIFIIGTRYIVYLIVNVFSLSLSFCRSVIALHLSFNIKIWKLTAFGIKNPPLDLEDHRSIFYFLSKFDFFIGRFFFFIENIFGSILEIRCVSILDIFISLYFTLLNSSRFKLTFDRSHVSFFFSFLFNFSSFVSSRSEVKFDGQNGKVCSICPWSNFKILYINVIAKREYKLSLKLLI